MVYSLLDTDLYKFTTSYAYMKLFPDAKCQFVFKDRNNTPRTEEFLENFKKAYKKYCEETFLSEEEWRWLMQPDIIPGIPKVYWEWLFGFYYEYDKVNIYLDENKVLCIEGPFDYAFKASLYEIPSMFLVPEVNNVDKPIAWTEFINDLDNKVRIAKKNEFTFSEFGTRRRFSQEIQDKVCQYLSSYKDVCSGTSNVYFAKKYGMKPIGTHPHEWFMFHGALFGYKSANKLALENWLNVYNGKFAIGLTDTYTSLNFFKAFDDHLARAYDGIRQDSGDEYEFIHNAINHYSKLNIDPSSKVLVFSNALDFNKIPEIHKYCKDHNLKDTYDVGTNLTCDVYSPTGEHYNAENIVMKMSCASLNDEDSKHLTVKLSDDYGKHTGDKTEIEHAKYDLELTD